MAGCLEARAPPVPCTGWGYPDRRRTRYFVIVGSGVVGALMMVHGAIGVAGKEFGVSPASSGVWVVVPFDPAPGQRWVPIAWGVLALAGIAVQLGWTGGEKGRVGSRAKPKTASA